MGFNSSTQMYFLTAFYSVLSLLVDYDASGTI
jgi:hypothetical protein